ncbi:MAG: hypothetical protein FWG13_06830 [Leptospirales bacterium]|nr:hypothetical protein [Leptospirales bacterium]
MDLIARAIIKIAVFCAALAVYGKFFLAFFRRKEPQMLWFDSKVIFTAGILSALTASIVSRVVKLFI